MGGARTGEVQHGTANIDRAVDMVYIRFGHTGLEGVAALPRHHVDAQGEEANEEIQHFGSNCLGRTHVQRACARADKGWFPLFRFYGPDEPFLQKTWKPPDIQKVK